MVLGKSNQDKIKIREIKPADQGWIEKILTQYWGSPKIISRGRVHWANKLPGFVAKIRGARVGLVTYEIRDNECEIVTLNSEKQKIGVGTCLVEKDNRIYVTDIDHIDYNSNWTTLSYEMLEDIDKETVPFGPNFDNIRARTGTEPPIRMQILTTILEPHLLEIIPHKRFDKIAPIV